MRTRDRPVGGVRRRGGALTEGAIAPGREVLHMGLDVVLRHFDAAVERESR
jgi:hypothetical protein